MSALKLLKLIYVIPKYISKYVIPFLTQKVVPIPITTYIFEITLSRRKLEHSQVLIQHSLKV